MLQFCSGWLYQLKLQFFHLSTLFPFVLWVAHQFAKGPLTHRTMDVAQRVQNLMTGFVLLDLYWVLSACECNRRNLPPGSLFMAGATTKNLQQAALGGIAVLASKDAHGNPFFHGHLHLTEIAVEEYFSRLRVQSPSAQLSGARWRPSTASSCTSARTMLRHKRSSEKRTSPECTDVLHPITPEEFELHSERELSASLKLVSFTSGFAMASLEDLPGFLSTKIPEVFFVQKLWCKIWTIC